MKRGLKLFLLVGSALMLVACSNATLLIRSDMPLQGLKHQATYRLVGTPDGSSEINENITQNLGNLERVLETSGNQLAERRTAPRRPREGRQRPRAARSRRRRELPRQARRRRSHDRRARQADGQVPRLRAAAECARHVGARQIGGELSADMFSDMLTRVRTSKHFPLRVLSAALLTSFAALAQQPAVPPPLTIDRPISRPQAGTTRQSLTLTVG